MAERTSPVSRKAHTRSQGSGLDRAPRPLRGAVHRSGVLPSAAALRALLVVSATGALLGCDPTRPSTWARDAEHQGRRALEWLGVIEPMPLAGAMEPVHPMPKTPPVPSSGPSGSAAPSGAAAPIDAGPGST